VFEPCGEPCTLKAGVPGNEDSFFYKVIEVHLFFCRSSSYLPRAEDVSIKTW
jgi:hypothetical protein